VTHASNAVEKIRAGVALPFEIEKWLLTIKAHCTVIADPGPDDDIRVLTDCIKINVDDELRPAIIAALSAAKELLDKPAVGGGWKMMQRPISEAPKDGSIFWSLDRDKWRATRFCSAEETAKLLDGKPEDFNDVWADPEDGSDNWEPKVWLSYEALSANKPAVGGGSWQRVPMELFKTAEAFNHYNVEKAQLQADLHGRDILYREHMDLHERNLDEAFQRYYESALSTDKPAVGGGVERNAVLEEAAQWHDQMQQQYYLRSLDDQYSSEEQVLDASKSAWHSMCASCIRALSTVSASVEEVKS